MLQNIYLLPFLLAVTSLNHITGNIIINQGSYEPSHLEIPSKAHIIINQGSYGPTHVQGTSKPHIIVNQGSGDSIDVEYSSPEGSPFSSNVAIQQSTITEQEPQPDNSQPQDSSSPGKKSTSLKVALNSNVVVGK